MVATVASVSQLQMHYCEAMVAIIYGGKGSEGCLLNMLNMLTYYLSDLYDSGFLFLVLF